MRRTSAVALGGLALALAAAVCGVAISSAAAKPSCPLPAFGSGGRYHPAFDATTFTANVDNPLFPLTPGMTLIYAGTKDGRRAIDVFAVTSRRRKVDGVMTRVVEDRLFLNGVLEERTTDYYSQDVCGNVWYFGEGTAVLDKNGHVIDAAGSFRAGVDGAQPGVYMEAKPELNREFRQEWLPGQAEDAFKVVALSASIKVPYFSFEHALRTEERTALEPGVLDNKYYARGIGVVLEKSVKGPTEVLHLIDVIS